MKKIGLLTCQEYAELAIEEQHLIPHIEDIMSNLIPEICDLMVYIL